MGKGGGGSSQGAPPGGNQGKGEVQSLSLIHVVAIGVDALVEIAEGGGVEGLRGGGIKWGVRMGGGGINVGG